MDRIKNVAVACISVALLTASFPVAAKEEKKPASPAKKPVPAASPTASPSPSPSPKATPVVVAAAPKAASASSRSSFAVEAGVVGYVRWAAKRYDPVAPGVSVTVLRPIGAGSLSAGPAIGWRHHTGGRTLGEYGGRVLPPYHADVEAVPIEGVARWTGRSGSLRILLQAGGGLEYARSSFVKADETPRRWRENDWAITTSAGAGAQRHLLGGELTVRVGARFARHAFTAHDFELLHGVESTLGWQRSF